MKQLHFTVGLFVLLGAACLAVLSINIARSDFEVAGGYELKAVFSNCGGLRSGSPVAIAGVEIGRIKRIALEDDDAAVTLTIRPGIVLKKDAMASIKTRGLIGEKFIEITQGGEDDVLKPGGRILNTESAVDFEGLISKFIHGNVGGGGGGGEEKGGEEKGAAE